MADKFQLISNLQPLNIYTLDCTVSREYDKIMEVYNLLNSDKLTINKLTRFIKMHNKSDTFTLILNLIPYPILVIWVYELNVMRYYWTDFIISNLVSSNKLTLKILYLNKKYDEAYKHIITLNNQYNIYYNYTDNIIQKRWVHIKEKLKEIFNMFLKEYDFDEIIFGSDFVEFIGNNTDNSDKPDMCISLYLKNNINFKSETLVTYKYPYYYLKHDNIILRFYEFETSINDIILYGIDDAIYIKSEDKFMCNAKFYQNLENPISNQVNHVNQNINISEHKIVKTFGIKLKKLLTIDYDIPKCYQCKQYYNNKIYIEDYEFLCISCADENYRNKNLKVNLQNQTFLITGGRVKLGYASALKLLRFGAKVIITTRYPNFAMSNYQEESDYEVWKDNLTIIECDFTKLKEIYAMLDLLQNYTFNGIINNACQTIKASNSYYDKVKEIETNLKNDIVTNNNRITSSNNLDIVLYNDKINILNNTIYDKQIKIYKTRSEMSIFKDIKDVQHESSWNKKIDEITPEEIVETTLINQIVPTLIINKLKHRLTKPKFIINVTSFEGSFNYNKSDKHIHTNMCKTAMNMMIRTLHEDSDKDLYVYAINPGYVSGICPQSDKYPVGLEDGATRILYPIIKYYIGEPLDKSIMIMQNYKKADW
jgi:NAD(P)-dependent dehydrogenase (short-subunit alcohol dehydrogenase family)